MTPSYYASGESAYTFEVRGRNFHLIPANAVGFISYRNDDPMGGNETKAILEKTDTRMVIGRTTPAAHSALYLGGIASADKQQVYWINNSSPLP